MKQLRLLGIFTLLIICHFKINAQIGNYVKRTDSTTTSPYIKYNFVLGTNAAKYLDSATLKPYYGESDSEATQNNTIIGSSAASRLGKNPSGTQLFYRLMDNR